MRIPAQAEELQSIRQALGTWLDGQGAPPEVGAEVALAVHEAAANVVEHAYPRGSGELIVRACHDNDRLVVVVEDEGEWRGPSPAGQRGGGVARQPRGPDDGRGGPAPAGGARHGG